MFTNRNQAGQLLAGKVIAELQELPPSAQHMETIVIGLLPGGVALALELALALRSDLGVISVSKISPSGSGLALAAVSSSGVFVANENLGFCVKDFSNFIEKEKSRLELLSRQQEEKLLHAAGLKANPEPRGKRVVLVDEGDSSALPALAALKTLRLKGARQVVLATPVISASSCTRLQEECDLIVSLVCPPGFAHVAQFYEDFHPVKEEEIVAALRSLSHVHSLSNKV